MPSDFGNTVNNLKDSAKEFVGENKDGLVEKATEAVGLGGDSSAAPEESRAVGQERDSTHERGADTSQDRGSERRDAGFASREGTSPPGAGREADRPGQPTFDR